MQNKITGKILIACIVGELLVAGTAIGFALAYQFDAYTLPNTSKVHILIMGAIYALLAIVLLWLLIMLIRAYKNNLNSSKVILIIVLVIASVLAGYTLVKTITDLITPPGNIHPLLSLVWNIPKLLLNATTTTFCALSIRKAKMTQLAQIS